MSRAFVNEDHAATHAGFQRSGIEKAEVRVHLPALGVVEKRDRNAA